jgi:hypothetical protein
MATTRIRLLAIVGVALLAGFLIGTWRASARVDSGRADTTIHGDGSISTDEWTYGFAADVNWIDANNTWHEDGPIDCLPPGSSVEGLRFAWVEATVEGTTWRPVVWIDCRSVPQA